jgi:hypothetical protein
MDEETDAVVDHAPERETSEVKLLRSQVEALQRDFSARLNRESDAAVKRERERAIDEFESERRRIAVSPQPAHERARKFEDVTRAEMEVIKRFRDEDVRRQQAQPVQHNLPPEVKDWSKRNSWYLALKKAGSPIADEAEAIHVALNAQGVPLKDNLEEVTRRMAQQYPHLVESAVRRKNPAKRQQGWADIPAEDRKTAEESLIHRGIYGKDEATARERYARAYFNEYGDHSD